MNILSETDVETVLSLLMSRPLPDGQMLPYVVLLFDDVFLELRALKRELGELKAAVKT